MKGDFEKRTFEVNFYNIDKFEVKMNFVNDFSNSKVKWHENCATFGFKKKLHVFI